MPNGYTVTLSDGTNTATLPVTADSHESACRTALDQAPIDWSKLNDGATLTITITQP